MVVDRLGAIVGLQKAVYPAADLVRGDGIGRPIGPVHVDEPTQVEGIVGLQESGHPLLATHVHEPMGDLAYGQAGLLGLVVLPGCQ